MLGVLLLPRAGAAQTPPPDPPPPVLPWYEVLELSAFADAYTNVNFNFPKPQRGANRLRAYDDANGFALSWVGFDARYEPDPVGGAVELRLGPTAGTHAGADAGSGLEFVKQAYASWRPGGADGSVRLDFGKFDSIYGAEVAESQRNPNYTRGVVYWALQPKFFAGLHGSWQITPALELHGLVVNGQNRAFDNNIGKTYGAQVRVAPSAAFGVSFGWLGGPEQADFEDVDCGDDEAYDPDSGGCAPAPGTQAATYTVDRGGANSFVAWRHLFDLVVTLDVTETLRFVVNADYGLEGVRRLASPRDTVVDSKSFYGAMLGARLQIDEIWAVAARGEYLVDADAHLTNGLLANPGSELTLATATLTLEAAPTEHLLLRLEGRGDFALDGEPSRDVFEERARDTTSSQITTTLGVVVKTN